MSISGIKLNEDEIDLVTDVYYFDTSQNKRALIALKKILSFIDSGIIVDVDATMYTNSIAIMSGRPTIAVIDNSRNEKPIIEGIKTTSSGVMTYFGDSYNAARDIARFFNVQLAIFGTREFPSLLKRSKPWIEIVSRRKGKIGFICDTDNQSAISDARSMCRSVISRGFFKEYERVDGVVDILYT